MGKIAIESAISPRKPKIGFLAHDSDTKEKDSYERAKSTFKALTTTSTLMRTCKKTTLTIYTPLESRRRR